VLLLCS